MNASFHHCRDENHFKDCLAEVDSGRVEKSLANPGVTEEGMSSDHGSDERSVHFLVWILGRPPWPIDDRSAEAEWSEAGIPPQSSNESFATSTGRWTSMHEHQMMLEDFGVKILACKITVIVEPGIR